MTVEEAYLLCKLARKFDPQAVLALGPVPVVGKDETFPGKFTIHAEKCPNRKGVEEVLAHFCGGRSKRSKNCSNDLSAGRHQSGMGQRRISQAALGSTIPRPSGLAARVAHRARHVRFAAVEAATYQLPGAGFAERAGSYVNYADRLQSFTWAIRPPAGVWVEGQLYWPLLGMRGLYNPRKYSTKCGEDLYFTPPPAKFRRRNRFASKSIAPE